MLLWFGCICKFLNRKKINGWFLEFIVNYMFKFFFCLFFLKNKVNIENLKKKFLGKIFGWNGKNFFYI